MQGIRRQVFICACALLALVFQPYLAGALTVRGVSFSELVSKAEIVLIGTVSKVESRWDDEEKRQKIYTFVTFSDLEMLKGDIGGDTYTIRILGGRVGDTMMIIPGLPEFEMGKRYALFVEMNEHSFFPVVGVGQGVYAVEWDAAAQQFVVKNMRSHPLVEELDEKAGGHPQTSASPPEPLGSFRERIKKELLK